MRDLFIEEKFRHRHKILGALQEKLDANSHPNAMAEDIELTFSILAKNAGLTDTQLLKQIDYLHSEGDIDINERDFVTNYLILRKGTVAFFDDKYLNLGWKTFLDNLYDIIKIVSAIILLAIATLTFISNIIDTKSNKKEIEKIKTDFKNIKDSLSIKK